MMEMLYEILPLAIFVNAALFAFSLNKAFTLKRKEQEV